MLPLRSGVLPAIPAACSGVWPRWLLAVVMLLLTGCATFTPPVDPPRTYLERAETQVQGDLEVTTAVLSATESEQMFGVPLANSGIQPVWIRIRNNEPVAYWFYAIGLDPGYFSPDEAAWRSKVGYASKSTATMEEYFRDRRIHEFVRPNHTISGFMFTNLDEGSKAVNISLIGLDNSERSYNFVIDVPGLQTDRDKIDDPDERDALYPPGAVRDIENPDDLRAWIEALPCCVSGDGGDANGDPLNLVVIGHDDDIIPAFTIRGWQPTETITSASVWKTVRSYLLGSRYRYSPVSPLYMYGRKQDFAAQKARETVNARIHLRLWLGPARYQGMRIWVGQVSLDVGVRLTGRLSPLTTHVIDPHVDEARWYLTQDLVASQRVSLVALAKGVGQVFPGAPRYNALGDPYFTDGLRLVTIFTRDLKSLDEVDLFEWEQPPDIRLLKTEDLN